MPRAKRKRNELNLTAAQERKRKLHLRMYREAQRERKEAKAQLEAEWKNEELAAVQGGTYGERNAKNKRLIHRLDEAFNAGYNESSKWAKGVQDQLRQEVRGLKASCEDVGRQLRRSNKLCDLLLEKYAGVS